MKGCRGGSRSRRRICGHRSRSSRMGPTGAGEQNSFCLRRGESMNLLLRNRQPPGDVLMLTAAVRDLHRSHPGAYCTAVDTACPALWENNPLVVSPGPGWVADRVIDCEYPLVHDANRKPFHFIHG